MSDPLQVAIQSLAPSALLELFEVDFTPLDTPSDNIYRFHCGTNKLSSPVVWNGDTYAAWPIEVTGFSKHLGGTLPRINVKIGNKDGLLSGLGLNFNDYLGAKLTRHRVFAEHLDAVNFPGSVNPSADPSVKLKDDIFFMIQKLAENKELVELEFAAEFDVEGVMLPRRQVSANCCPWVYRGDECEYAGKPVADDLGNLCPVTPTHTAAPFTEWNETTAYTLGATRWYKDPRRIFVCLQPNTGVTPLNPAFWFEDVCGKCVSDCKLRKRTNDVYPYGGFPGTARIPSSLSSS